MICPHCHNAPESPGPPPFACPACGFPLNAASPSLAQPGDATGQSDGIVQPPHSESVPAEGTQGDHATSVLPDLSFPPSPPGPGILGAIGSILLWIFVLCVFAVFYVVRRARPSEFAVLSLQTVVLVLLAVLGGRRRPGDTALRSLGIRMPKFRHVVIVALMSLPLLAINWQVTEWATAAIYGSDTSTLETTIAPVDPGTRAEPSESKRTWGMYRPRLRTVSEQILSRALSLPWYLAVLVLCVQPCIAEEVFFRGYIGRGLVARLGVVPGVLITSFLFALMHVEPTHAIGTLVMGITLHFVFLATKSLPCAFLLHFLNNGFAVGLIWVARAQSWRLAETLGEGRLPILIFLAALVSFVLIAFELYEVRTVWRTADGSSWSPGYVTAETPPPELAARPIMLPGRRITRLTAGLALGLFGLSLASNGWEAPTAVMLIRRGIDAYDAGDYERAIPHFSEAIQRYPTNALAYTNRSLAYGMLQRHDDAIADCTTAISLDPQSADAYSNRGWLYLEKGDYEHAISDCSEALRLNPSLVFALQSRGRAYEGQRAYGDAIADFDRARALDPADSYIKEMLDYLLQMQEAEGKEMG
jgi:tetratricopeptide (TPR) repeat protein